MTLSELSVRRPILMTMVYLLICVIALVFLPRLDIALYPQVDLPVISVIVNCNDAGPEEIEQQVAKELEDYLGSIENLDTFTTVSQEGMCFAILEFDYGTNLDDAQTDLTTLVSRVTRVLPDWAEAPQIFRFDAIGGSRVATLVVQGERPRDELLSLADDTIAPIIERIPGVAQVTSYGGGDTIYNVNVDPNRLEAYNISFAQVIAALSSRNLQVTEGTVTWNGVDFQVASDERYMNLEEMRQTVITTIDGVPVRIQDVAEISQDEETGGNKSYLNGVEVVSMRVTNDSDSSATRVADDVIAAIPGINDGLPEGVTLTLQNDNTQMIRDTMSEVYNSAYQGVLLAALVIYIFLRGIKTTLIISLSMPISILFTLMVMAIAGVSINFMSMSGLILGIGMIVDASIVILENTFTYRQMGQKAAIAAILGSKNMFNAIFASTMTTLCVFVPFIIFKYDLEMIGVMIQDLVITICVSLACSLFVSVTLVPALCGSILKINTRTQKPLKNRVLKKIDDAFANAEEKLRSGYVKVLRYFLHHKFLLIMFLVLLLLFSFVQFGRIGIDFVPRQTTDDQVEINLELEPGTNDAITTRYLFDLQTKVMDALPRDAWIDMMISVSGNNEGTLTIELPDITEQTMGVEEIKDIVRPLFGDDPSATWSFSDSRGVGISPIDVEIHSTDTNQALAVANQVVDILSTHVPQVTNIVSDINNGAPKLSVQIDHERAHDLGVSVSDITGALTTAINGTVATQITTFDANTTYDVYVQLADNDITSINDIGSILVPSTTSGFVRVDSVADFIFDTSPIQIVREDKIRVNHVTADLASGYSTSDVQPLVDQALNEYLMLPEGVEIIQSGELSEFSKYATTLVMIVALALFLVYAVMAAQFESLMDPFIIFATIPLLLIGVIWVHIFMNQSFSLFSIIGVVALIGVVVNNGIVLIDCINRLVEHKIPVEQACLQAAHGRLRPILMSTITTIVGLIPMAFFPGNGSEMIQPIALTFFGGMMTGAMLTLFLSPTLYLLLNKRKEKNFDNPDSLINQLREYDMNKMQNIDAYL